MKRNTIWNRVWNAAIALALGALLLGLAPSVWADDAQDATQLVDKARLTFEGFITDDDMGPALRSLVKGAKGVLVYPQILRGAFIVGVSGGSGVFLAKDDKTDVWGGPAFYTIGQGSFGLQAGGDASEVVLVALTDRGVAAMLANSAKLGANASVAAGPVGAGAEASTANISADIIAYSRAKGLYAGISLDGAVVATRDALNHAYYGKEVSPTDILIKRTVKNPQAARLMDAVAKVARGKYESRRQ